MTTCQICGGVTSYFTTTRSGSYHHCAICDFIFADRAELLPSTVERARYEQHDNSLDNEGYVRRFETFIAAAIEPFTAAQARALDYGCGPGPVLQTLLQRQGYEVDVYDPYFAPERPDQQFDLITCTEVLEHAYRPKEIWADFDRMLHPGGHLAVMTLFHPGVDRFDEWWYKTDDTHVCFYSLKTLHWISRHTCFELIYHDERQTAVFRKAH